MLRQFLTLIAGVFTSGLRVSATNATRTFAVAGLQSLLKTFCSSLSLSYSSTTHWRLAINLLIELLARSLRVAWNFLLRLMAVERNSRSKMDLIGLGVCRPRGIQPLCWTLSLSLPLICLRRERNATVFAANQYYRIRLQISVSWQAGKHAIGTHFEGNFREIHNHIESHHQFPHQSTGNDQWCLLSKPD
jgi:hypothetical protein